MYIVIEGQDGTGKSTQVELLAEKLRGEDKEVLTFHEPDGELEAAHAMRAIIKDKKYNLEPMTHVLLFTAARYELWKKLAEPVLRRGGYVISARNWWSTLAYQGYGQGVSKSKIIRLTKEVMPELYVHPDKSVILTLDDEVRKARELTRDAAHGTAAGTDTTSATDTFESKPDTFQTKVNHAYLKIAKDFNIPTLSSDSSIKQVSEELQRLIF